MFKTKPFLNTMIDLYLNIYLWIFHTEWCYKVFLLLNSFDQTNRSHLKW